jgi:hypothetical protein
MNMKVGMKVMLPTEHGFKRFLSAVSELSDRRLRLGVAISKLDIRL